MLRHLAAAVLLRAWRDIGVCKAGRRWMERCRDCHGGCDVLAFWKGDDCRVFCEAVGIDRDGALAMVQRELCR